MNKTKLKLIDLCVISLSCAIICVSAWIAVPLTVSITLQTFAVCACAGLLGTKKGLLTIILYICLGLVGLPVFTGFRGGIGVLFGVTGGYIIGFIFTGLIVGLAADIFGRKMYIMLISMVIGIAVLYMFGSVWYWILYTNKTGSASMKTILANCVLPFIGVDIIKIILASVVVSRLYKYIPGNRKEKSKE